MVVFIRRYTHVFTIFLFIISISAGAVDENWSHKNDMRGDPTFNISVQPLRLLFQTISASFEHKLSSSFSYVIPVRASVNYVLPWDVDPGWRVRLSTGVDVKIHLIGEALSGGFYIQPGIEIGWRRKPNFYDLQILTSMEISRVRAYLFNPVYVYWDYFLNTDARMNVGYDYAFANGISLDVNGGFALTTVFALGEGGGWFYTLPTPLLEFSVGLNF